MLHKLLSKVDFDMPIESATDPDTGLYEDGCVWSPYPSHQRVRASLMDHQYLTVVGKHLNTYRI